MQTRGRRLCFRCILRRYEVTETTLESDTRHSEAAGRSRNLRSRRGVMKAAPQSTSMTLKTILFATDFSDSARRAQSYATGLSNRFRAKVIVVHAKEAPNYALPPESWRRADDADALQMQELRQSLPKLTPGLECEFCVGEGTAWQIVEAALEKNKADLIVLGTRGRTGATKLLLGSQAETILRRASCPVLTVGPHAKTITGGEKELQEV